MVTGLLVLAVPAGLALCLLLGAAGIGLPDASTVTGRAILELRVSRVWTGFIVGAALSCAGVVLQALLRNPLAEPYVLGVSSGAGLGAAAAIVSGAATAGMLALPLSAFAGAVVTLVLVYGLARAGGRLSIYGLILSGVMVSAVCSSLLMFLVSVAPVEGLHSILWWMLGNLQAPSHGLLIGCSVLIAAAVVAVWVMAPELNAMALGQDLAHFVGVRTAAVMVAGLAAATLAASAAVSLAGLIGFVGLVVPHAVRQMTGPNHRTLIPLSALMGGVFLAVCDALARTVLAPVEIPVGVITALIGGPFFLAILHRRRRKTEWTE